MAWLRHVTVVGGAWLRHVADALLLQYEYGAEERRFHHGPVHRSSCARQRSRDFQFHAASPFDRIADGSLKLLSLHPHAHPRADGQQC